MYTFVQSADISFIEEKVAYTNQGKPISEAEQYKFNQSILANNMKYQSKTYTVNENGKDVVKGYVIEGLDKNLFTTIGANSIIQGVTLVDGSGAFADTNHGTINSCAIRPLVADKDSYSRVVIKQDSGFVLENSITGKIYNSYVVGTVIGNETNEDTSNPVSGFVLNNAGQIDSCYANVIIQGENRTSVSGFIYKNEFGLPSNSFVTGAIYSGGTVYGFVGGIHGIQDKINNCYTSLFEVKGQNIYMFGYIDRGNDKDMKDCVWLPIASNHIFGSISKNKSIGKEISYDSLLSKIEVSTYKFKNEMYDNIERGDTNYPFRFYSTADAYLTPQFWGDFPKK